MMDKMDYSSGKMSGSDAKPTTGIGATLPTVPIGEANPGRNYPKACDSEAKSNTVGGSPMAGGNAPKDTDPMSTYK